MFEYTISIELIRTGVSTIGQGYKQLKAKLGMRKVRPWKWMPFTNPARKDGAVFHHWRRVADEGKEYPFAKFNKVSIICYFIFRISYCYDQ